MSPGLSSRPRPVNRLSYQPLDATNGDIRLVSIHPGKGKTILRCDLIHRKLDESCYEALSYTWGTPIFQERIYINGSSLPVTQNLKVALYSLRLEDAPRLIWIDAICINQKDVEERNVQVLRMRDIYQKAKRTVVFLGPSNAASDDAMNFINESAQKIPGVTKNSLWLSYPSSSIPDALSHAGLHNGTHIARFRAMKVGILDRAWWRRVWVVQEVAVARDVTVVCGLKETSWDSLDLFSWLLYSFRPNRLAIRAVYSNQLMSTIRMEWHKNSELAQPGDYIYQCRSQQSSLPEDKVNGLLGLCKTSDNDEDEWLLKPNYCRQAWETYARLTIYTIKKSKSLRFITIQASYTETYDLPSWVPELAAPHHSCAVSLIDPFTDHTRFYNACHRFYDAFIKYSLDLRMLAVQGFKVSTIKKTGLKLDLGEDTEAQSRVLFQDWKAHIASDHDIVAERYGAEHIGLAFSKTLLCDRGWYLEHEIGLNRLGDGKGFFDYMTGSALEKAGLFQNLDFALQFRRFIVSEAGHIGLAPEIAMERDLLCVLIGCDVPVVLRQRGGDWEFIGDW